LEDLSQKFGGHCESVVNRADRVLALDGNRILALGGGVQVRTTYSMGVGVMIAAYLIAKAR
jgi:hypothetical protein